MSLKFFKFKAIHIWAISCELWAKHILRTFSAILSEQINKSQGHQPYTSQYLLGIFLGSKYLSRWPWMSRAREYVGVLRKNRWAFCLQLGYTMPTTYIMNPKKTVKNGWLVISNHFLCKGLKWSNWNNHLQMVVFRFQVCTTKLTIPGWRVRVYKPITIYFNTPSLQLGSNPSHLRCIFSPENKHGTKKLRFRNMICLFKEDIFRFPGVFYNIWQWFEIRWPSKPFIRSVHF